MTSERLLDKKALAQRWGLSVRSLDRMRLVGRLPWLDLSYRGTRPTVRFRLADVLAYEARMVRGRDVVPVGEVVRNLMESPEVLVAAAQQDDGQRG